ncbi:hypothetical protein [Paraburkholderia caffeinilytica]|uniref:hypothetical protein n=1 Tax=Paraburkholderia caffeinilytica TaxID=1761016 RepID=UPI0038B9D90F
MPLADGTRAATRCSAASCLALASSSAGRDAEAGWSVVALAAVFEAGVTLFVVTPFDAGMTPFAAAVPFEAVVTLFVVATPFMAGAPFAALAVSPAPSGDFAVSGLSLLLTAFAAVVVCVDGADATSPGEELASAHADISSAAVTSAAPAPARVHHVSPGGVRATRHDNIL